MTQSLDSVLACEDCGAHAFKLHRKALHDGLWDNALTTLDGQPVSGAKACPACGSAHFVRVAEAPA